MTPANALGPMRRRMPARPPMMEMPAAETAEPVEPAEPAIEPEEEGEQERIVAGYRKPGEICATCKHFDGAGSCTLYGFSTEGEATCGEGWEAGGGEMAPEKADGELPQA